MTELCSVVKHAWSGSCNLRSLRKFILSGSSNLWSLKKFTSVCLFIPNCTKKNDLISYNIYIYIYIYNQRNSQIADQTRALDVATKFENLKICVRNNGRVLSRFSFATAAEKLLKQRKHSQKHCFLVVGSEKVVFREGNCKGNRKLRADPA